MPNAVSNAPESERITPRLSLHSLSSQMSHTICYDTNQWHVELTGSCNAVTWKQEITI